MVRDALPVPADEFERQFAEAEGRGHTADETEPRADRAYYDAQSGRVVIELKGGCMFAFPSALGQGLADASQEQLAEVKVVQGGFGLRWESLDADLSIPSLLAGHFGSKRWMSQLGRAGGKVTSEAKAQAARANGKKGGRPRKT